MQPSLEKLRKFFRLEHENGYSDSAIIGGLAKMLDYWEGEARADHVQEEVIQAVVQRLRSYNGLSPQSRSDALRGLWKRIGETYPETQQKPRNGPPNRRSTPNGSIEEHRLNASSQTQGVERQAEVIEQKPQPEPRPRERESAPR